MISTALVRLYPGRPAFVKGVCISTHDHWYFTTVAMLRSRARESHPDHWLPNGRHPAKALWVKHGGAYTRFLAEQRAWYAQYDLAPPTRQAFTPQELRWATRVAKYGPSGFSEMGLQRIKNSIIDRAKRWQTRLVNWGATGGKKVARTHCKKGHPYGAQPYTTIVNGRTKRLCRICYRAAQKRAYYRHQLQRRKVA